MAAKTAGMKLCRQSGSWGWAEFQIRRAATNGVIAGYWVMVDCDGPNPTGLSTHGHWLRPDPANPNRVINTMEPFVWQTWLDADAARDRYRAQAASTD